MGREQAFQAKVTVNFGFREDGGLRAQSDDVPGFYLSGSDPLAVLSDVIPALAQIFKMNYGLEVDVHPLADARFMLSERRKKEVRLLDMPTEYACVRKAA